MNLRGKILLADDEEVFLLSTADLLRREGYECDTVADGYAAARALAEKPYHVLVTDIKMAGNTHLELIKEVARLGASLAVIIVTGYPALETAVEAVELPVAAYLIKPFAFSQLLVHVQRGVARSSLFHTVERSRQQLDHWRDELGQVIDSLEATPESISPVPVDAFFKLTFMNIAHSLSDLAAISDALTGDGQIRHVCGLLNCPRSLRLTQALEETIRVLESTKNSYKSKELAMLRHQLEALLRNEPIMP